MFENDFVPCVVQAVPGENYTVYAYMNDGSVRLVDVKPLIAKGNLFKKLKDKDFFDSVTVMNNSVAWDLSGVRDPYNCIDLDPCMVGECPVVADPLNTEATA